MQHKVRSHRARGSISIATIRARIDFYARVLSDHPLLVLARGGEVPREILLEFARVQYADSILWIPMLSLMKERAQNPRLVRAIRENIADEAGQTGVSHVELARRFIRSLGIADVAAGTMTPDVVEMVSHWSRLPEPAIAGWLLAAECLVPILFEAMRVGYGVFPDANLRYLDEHITVDADVHSSWMREAILELLEDPGSGSMVMIGVDFGAREVFDVPDGLYAKSLWMVEERNSFSESA